MRQKSKFAARNKLKRMNLASKVLKVAKNHKRKGNKLIGEFYWKLSNLIDVK